MQPADKQQLLRSIQGKMEDLKDTLTYFKSDLYLVPRAKEGELRRKYEVYMEKLSKYDIAAKKLELVLNNDTVGLRELKNSYDPERMASLNQETKLLAKEGFQVQEDSKNALVRIKTRVGEI